MKSEFVFTSESVTEGHPDKLCDQVSDAIVDEFLIQDPYSRIIAECAVSNTILFIAARFASRAGVDLTAVARQVIGQVGYDRADFNSKTCSILTSLKELPCGEKDRLDERDLSEEELDLLAVSHQVTVFGYACTHTAVLMPIPIWLANKMAKRLSWARIQKKMPYLAPDGRAQVGVVFRDRLPARIHSVTVVTSQWPSAPVDPARLEQDIREIVLGPIFRSEPLRPDADTQIFINPEGSFSVGGPAVHSGLTGRKNAVDTYGEYSRQSERALSGKDPLRIDRAGAYAARHAAKNVVAAGLAAECEVQLSYSLGRSRPISIGVDTFGTGTVPDEEVTARVERCFDFRLGGIVKRFNLRHLPNLAKGAFYRKLAAYGQVGRDDLEPALPWEALDHLNSLRETAKALRR